MERITADTPAEFRAGHEFRYRLAAGFCEDDDAVVDAACGSGYGAALIVAERRIEYIGIDRDLGDVPPLRLSPLHELVEADLETWRPDFDFDVFVGFETIEHLADCTAYVAAAKRARRWIILSCPVVPTVGVNPYHRRDFERGELPTLFADNAWEHYQTVAQPSEQSEIYVLRRRS